MKKTIIMMFASILVFACAFVKAESTNRTFSISDTEELLSVASIGDKLYLTGRNGLYMVQKGDNIPRQIKGIDGIGYEDSIHYAEDAIEILFCIGDTLYGLNRGYGIVYEIQIDNDTGRAVEYLRLDWTDMVKNAGKMTYPMTWESVYCMDKQLYVIAYDIDDDMDYLHPSLRIYDLTGGEVKTAEIDNVHHILGKKENELVVMLYNREEEMNAVYGEPVLPRICMWDPLTEDIFELFQIDSPRAYGLLYHENRDTVYYVDNAKLYMHSLDGETRQAAYLSAAFITGVNACWLDDLYVCANLNMVDIRSVDPEKLPTTSINIYHSYADTPENVAFMKEHPDIPLRFSTEYYEDSTSLVQAFISGASNADVFFIDATDVDLPAMMKKGYCLDLTQYPQIANEVSNMYGFVQDAVTFEEHIYALPMSVSGSGWGIFSDIWDTLGLDIEQPQTLLDICELVNTWAERYSDEYPDYVVIEDVENYSRELTQTVFEMYMDYYSYQGIPITLDTELFRKVMNAVNSITEELDVTTPTEDEMFELWEKTALLCRRNDILTPTKNDYSLLLLTLDDEMPFVIHADMTVAFINPRSRNIDSAVEYLTFCAKNMSAVEKIKLFPDYNVPVEDSYYLNQVEIWEKEKSEILDGVEDDDDEHKMKAKERLAVLEASLMDKEDNRYVVSKEMIDTYRELAQYVMFFNQGEIRKNANRSDTVLGSLLVQYIDGVMDLERLISEGDQKLTMIREEQLVH